MRRRSRQLLFVSCTLALTLVASACGSSGPDLVATMDKVDAVGEPATATDLGIEASDTARLWQADGTPAEVADAITTTEKPDERADDADGDVFMLYPSGTLWLTAAAAGGTAVAYYADNDKAYNRHSGVLLANSRWGNRVNNYRRSSSSSGNGFRGGGSSSGK